ncbi:alpha/beta fold hydrolase [Candidatus Curtissbacteria bacterium]|nr:alpha/beta fold hydrolase [Candidatus Curtissbacteria bacterium]
MPIIQTKSFQLAINVRGDEHAKKLALVLPGRLDTKDYACFDSHLNYLAERGHFAVSFDPPGTWESPGGIELFTTTNYIKAVDELIEYFGNKPTILIGHSRGAAVAILAGSENSNVTSFVAIMAAFGDPSDPSAEAMKTGIHTSYRDLPPGTTKTKEQKKFLLPINYFIDGKRFNPLDSLKNCTKPKLLFYGTDDRFAEPAMVRELFKTIPEPKQLHELHTTHDYRHFPAVIAEVNVVIGDFLNKHG